MRTPLAKITYHWTNGEQASRLSYAGVRETVKADDDKVTLGGDGLKEITVEPYLGHADEWLLRVEFDDGRAPQEELITITEDDQKCALVHDADVGPSPNYNCKPIRGEAGWTLKVNTSKKVRAPGSINALDAAVRAAAHAAKAAEAAAKAAQAAIAALRTDED